MKHAKEMKIGIFVALVLVVSFFMINYLRGEDIFNREIELVSRYDDLEGLVASAPVYIKGYKAGKVKEVVYDPQTSCFEVTCSLLKEFNIPSDSKMTIYSVDIMGGKGIRIDLGDSSQSVSDGDFLEPSFASGLMDGLEDNIGPLLSKVGNTLDSLNVTVANVNLLLSETNRELFSSTLSHLEHTMSEVRGLAESVNGNSDELDSFISSLALLSSKLNDIADGVGDTVGKVDTLVGSIDEKDLESLISSFNVLLENINDPEGTIGKMFVDDSVYISLNSLLDDVDSLVKKIEENPRKYIKISVF